MNTITPPDSPSASGTSAARHDRALVLGGGGAVGNAWLVGVLAGLADGGAHPLDADLVVGTSAGATAAIQVTNVSLEALSAAVLASPAPAPPPGGGSASGHRGFGRSPNAHLERTGALIAASADAADMRRRIGANAIDLADEAGPDAQARWRETVARRLDGMHWPERLVRLTAVDARTGESVVFDRAGGTDLVDAVAASCAGGFAYRIADDWFVDGGYRRNENADLARGFARVLVLSPLGGRTRHPLAWGMQLDAQVAELRAGGSAVECVLPDAPSLDAFGENLLDLSRRPAVTRAGFEQGRSLAGRIGARFA